MSQYMNGGGSYAPNMLQHTPFDFDDPQPQYPSNFEMDDDEQFHSNAAYDYSFENHSMFDPNEPDSDPAPQFLVESFSKS